MTDIYLMRHGKAVPGHNMPDSARTLTAQGFEEIRQQAQLLAERQPPITKILHSPYARAAQTALIVNDLIQAEIMACPALIPMGLTARVVTLLAGEEKPLLLVTHLPLVAELATTLCDLQVTFFEGTIAKIERVDALALRGRLTWTAQV